MTPTLGLKGIIRLVSALVTLHFFTGTFAFGQSSTSDVDESSIHPFAARQAAEKLIDMSLEDGNGLIAAGVASTLLRSGVSLNDTGIWPLTELLEAAAKTLEVAPIGTVINFLIANKRQIPADQLDFKIEASASSTFCFVFKTNEEAVASTGLRSDSRGGNINVEVFDAQDNLVAKDISSAGGVGSSTYAAWPPEFDGEFTIRLSNVGTGMAIGSLFIQPHPHKYCAD